MKIAESTNGTGLDDLVYRPVKISPDTCVDPVREYIDAYQRGYNDGFNAGVRAGQNMTREIQPSGPCTPYASFELEWPHHETTTNTGTNRVKIW